MSKYPRHRIARRLTCERLEDRRLLTVLFASEEHNAVYAREADELLANFEPVHDFFHYFNLTGPMFERGDDLAAGDFNGDGVAEVAIASVSEDKVSIFTQVGQKLGDFDMAFNNTGITHRDRIAAGDVDGDGRDDIVRVRFGGVGDPPTADNPVTSFVEIFDASGNVKPDPPSIGFANFDFDEWSRLAVGDVVPGNDRDEIVVGLTGIRDPDIRVFDAWGNHQFGGDKNIFNDFDHLALADTDGDGFDEILVAKDGTTKIHIMDQGGAVVDTFNTDSERVGGAYDLNDGFAAADLNGDGEVEVIIANNGLDFIGLFDTDGNQLLTVDADFDRWDDVEILPEDALWPSRFQSRGPTTLTEGSVENVPHPSLLGNNPTIGAIHTVVAHPDDADIVYAGAVNGGVWKTTNALDEEPHWVTHTDDFPSLSISALAMDPDNPNRLIAGTGKLSSFGPGLSGPLSGLLGTENAGNEWHAIGEDDLAGANITGIALRDDWIVVSSRARPHDYSRAGVYRSTDGGESFAYLSKADPGDGELPLGVAYDLVADPVDPDVLYLAVAHAAKMGGDADDNGIYLSPDGGSSWDKISNEQIESLIHDVQPETTDFNVPELEFGFSAETVSTEITIEKEDLGDGKGPLITPGYKAVDITLNSRPGSETTAQQLADKVNNHSAASKLVVAEILAGDPDTPIPGPDYDGETLHVLGATSNIEIAVHANEDNGTNAVYVGIINVGQLKGLYRAEPSDGSPWQWTEMDLPEIAGTQKEITDIAKSAADEPFVVTSMNHGLPRDPDKQPRILIEGVQGPNVNRDWDVTVVDDDHFVLDDSKGVAAAPYTNPTSDLAIWRQRRGIHPVGQGAIHFSILADQQDPYVVYVGGDAQQGGVPATSTHPSKPNHAGARGSNGVLMRGHAAEPAGTDKLPSPQWTPLTHVGAVGPGVTTTPVDDASNPGGQVPITITSPGHGLATGNYVGIIGVQGNTGANGVFMVSVPFGTSNDQFELVDSVANGDYSGGGVWFVYDDTIGSAPHADSRDMVFNASGDIIEVNDGGIYRRTDPDSFQGEWFGMMGDLQVTEVHNIVYDANSHTLFAGTQDNGTIEQRGCGGEWVTTRTADGNDVAVDEFTLAPSDESIRYYGEQHLGSSLQRQTYGTSGNPSNEIQLDLPLPPGARNWPFVTPIVTNAIRPPDVGPLVLIHNGSFEQPGLADGKFIPHVPGWMVYPEPDGKAGVLNPQDEQFPGTTGDMTDDALPEMHQVAELQHATMVQGFPSELLKADTTYVLEVEVGRALDADPATFKVQLVAAGTVLAEKTALSPPRGEFRAATVTFRAEGHHAQIGQPLEIRLIATGTGSKVGPVVFDDVRLNKSRSTRVVVADSVSDPVARRIHESTNAGVATSSNAVRWREVPVHDVNEPGTLWRGVNSTATAPIAYGGRADGSDNPDVLYVGSGSHIWLRSEVDGELELIENAVSGEQPVLDIAVDPDNWRAAFAIDNNQVYMSTPDDEGLPHAWTDITGNLLLRDFKEFRSIEYVPGEEEDAIFVGGLEGVFRAGAKSGFEIWQATSPTLPNARVMDLDYNERDNVLAVGTMGRGAWILPNPNGDFRVAFVDSADDEADANVGDGICASESGKCTLRAAVQEANAYDGHTTIFLKPQTYQLSLAGDSEDDALTGDLDVSGEITILPCSTSLAAADVVIDGGGLDRVLHVLPGAEARVERITLRNGDADQGGGALNEGILDLADAILADNQASGYGGAIHNTGELFMGKSILSSNTADAGGGGIYNFGGSVEVRDFSAVLDNTAQFGGGIANALNGNVLVKGSRIGNNTADEDGGGIHNDEGEVQIVARKELMQSWPSEITHNKSRFGGGVSNRGGGMVRIIDSTVADNQATGSDTPGNGSEAGGGGVRNFDGEVEISKGSVVARNRALFGGGVANSDGGVVNISNLARVEDNEALGSHYGEVGMGGGIFNFQSIVRISDNVKIINNKSDGATDPDNDYAKSGRGGGIYSSGGMVTVSDSTIERNHTIGGSGSESTLGIGGTGQGGAIYITDGGQLTLTRSSVALNEAIGGDGTVVLVPLPGLRGVGGAGEGGGIFNDQGIVTIVDSVLSYNRAWGGEGGGESGGLMGLGGIASGGAIFNSRPPDGNVADLSLTRSTLADNEAEGGTGERGAFFEGSAFGGGISNFRGTMTITNSTLSGNRAVTAPVTGSVAAAQGGAIYSFSEEPWQVTNSTIAFNEAIGSSLDAAAFGGGVVSRGGAGGSSDQGRFKNTIIADNTANVFPDVWGSIHSEGHNLLGNDDGAHDTVASDMLGIDPLLEPLADNGGPTLTHALGFMSPAIDAADTSGAPAKDQRGVERPRDGDGDGSMIADIGAFEVVPAVLEVLAGANVIGQFWGSSEGSDPFDIFISPQQFSLPDAKTRLGFLVSAAGGGLLDPAAAEIRDETGSIVAPIVANADLTTTRSLALVDLSYGHYSVTVFGEHNSAGAYRVDAMLLGDTNGDRSVNREDGLSIRQMLGAVFGDPDYRKEADANLDRRITSFDYAQWRFNLGDSTTPNPLLLEVTISPCSAAEEIWPVVDLPGAADGTARRRLNQSQRAPNARNLHVGWLNAPSSPIWPAAPKNDDELIGQIAAARRPQRGRTAADLNNVDMLFSSTGLFQDLLRPTFQLIDDFLP